MVSDTAMSEPFSWQAGEPGAQGMDGAKLEAMRESLAARATKPLLVVKGDRICLEWYAPTHGRPGSARPTGRRAVWSRRAGSYVFYAGLDGEGRPRWTPDFGRRVPVFGSPGRCMRPDVMHNPKLERYLLCTATAYKPQAHPSVPAGPHHLGVCEAPEPWGPWRTVHFTDAFQGPRTQEDRFQPRFCPKWIGEDGRTLYLTYSCWPRGPYQLHIQKVTLVPPSTTSSTRH